MELFDEIYSTYYGIARRVLEAAKEGLTEAEIQQLAAKHGYQETVLHFVPRMIGEWGLLELRNGKYYPRLSASHRPISTLEKNWLKALLRDPRIDLFLDSHSKQQLAENLADCIPLYTPKDFSYFDQCEDADPYQEPQFIQHFRMLQDAMRHQQLLSISYESPRRRVTLTIFPWKFLYSQKDDKFRLLCGYLKKNGALGTAIINLARIQMISVSDKTPLGISRQYLENRFHHPQKKTAEFEISQERNAIERCMLLFAPYEKKTIYNPQKKNYLCSLTYPYEEESEILIRLLSFGPVIRVLSPEHLVEQIRERISRQAKLLELPQNKENDYE